MELGWAKYGIPVTSHKEILDGWYEKEKWTTGVQKTIFEMYAFS